jgi:hypothetical protein
LVVQSEHACPNRPQWKSLGCLHLVPSQQPVRQEMGLQPPPDPEPPPPDDPPDELPEALPDEPWGCEHAPAWQVAPNVAQFWHAPPPAPHAVSTMPPAQAPVLSQHPGHEGPQAPPPSSPPLALPPLLPVLLPEALPVPPLPLVTPLPLPLPLVAPLLAPLLPRPLLPPDPGDESAAWVAPSPFEPPESVPL